MDLRTIFLIDFFLLLFLSGLLLVIRLSTRRSAQETGAYWLSAALCSGALGTLLIGLRGEIPLGLSIFGGNFLILFSMPLINRSVSRLMERRGDHFLLLTALAVAALALLVPFTYFRPDIRIRAQIDCFYLAIGICVSTLPLMHARAEIKPATRLMSGLMFFFALSNVVRGVGVRSSNLPVAWLMWSSTCAIVGLAVAYVWVDSLRIRSELERQALTDPLTGLFNRRAIELEIQRELYRVARTNQSISALMIDMDRFKQLNDTYGHAVGDRALCAVARAMEASVRGTDIVARISGDEFLVILPETGQVGTELIARRIAHTISGIRIPAGQSLVEVSCSIGTTTLAAADATMPALFRSSDEALYVAKSGAPLKNAEVL